MPFDTSIIEKNREKLAQKQQARQESIKANLKGNKPSYLGKIKKEEVLAIVKNKGPITTTGLKRELKVETYLISAILSELVNSKVIKLTNVKKGTGIFYYAPGQETKLEGLTNYLNPKDQDTVKLLKQKKVIEDKTQELFTRVSVRKIKDYAIPINIRISKDEVRLFWKYFLISDDEAKAVIREILRPFVGTKPKVQDKIKKVKPIINKTTELKDKSFDHPIKKLNKTKENKEQQRTLQPIEKEEKVTNPNIDEKLIGTEFYENLEQRFYNKGITIESAKQIRKGKELDLILLIKTSLGRSRYYAKYKSKKRCNDADISTAVVIAQSKNLPAAFITTGEIAKKTKENINTLFHNVMIVERFE